MAAIRLLELRNTFKWGGGPDKTILLSAEQHDPSRVKPILAYVRDWDDTEFRLAKKARERGLKLYDIQESRKLDPRVLTQLEGIIDEHDIDLIHSHDYKSDMFAYLLRTRRPHKRIAIISTLHGWTLEGLRDKAYWYADVFFMKHFDHLIAVSMATKDRLVAAGVEDERISVIHNGIDTKTWLTDCSTLLRDELGLNHDMPIVGYVGRITGEKDLVTWLRAAAVVSREEPETRFVLVGDGRVSEAVSSLQRLAATLEIGDRVHFLGYREDLLQIYAGFQVLLMSSRREGLSNAILEGMALGVPVVATDAGGTSELVVDGETGFLLRIGDVTGLANATIRLLRNEALRKRMETCSQQRIQSTFSFSKRLRRIEGLYEAIVGK